MNRLGWVLTNSEDFVVAIEAYLAELDKQFCSGPPEEQSEGLLEQNHSLQEFVNAVTRLLRGEMDPLKLPRAVQANGQPIPNYFVLRVGPWLGFYRLDCVNKVGVGVIALHEDEKLQDKLAKLLAEAAKKPR